MASRNSTTQRRFSRLPFQTASRLAVPAPNGPKPSSDEAVLYDTELIDISLKGALVECPAGIVLPVGAEARLEVRLPDSEVCIEMETEVAHAEQGRLGLHCVSIDMDSMIHLRRLMELNLGDPGLLDRELFDLG